MAVTGSLKLNQRCERREPGAEGEHQPELARHGATAIDPERSDDDKDNFYMEREWRSLNNIHFEIKDIERIIIPKSFAQIFRNDIPDYLGQLTFSDDHISKPPQRNAKSPVVVCTPDKLHSVP